MRTLFLPASLALLVTPACTKDEPAPTSSQNQAVTTTCNATTSDGVCPGDCTPRTDLDCPWYFSGTGTSAIGSFNNPWSPDIMASSMLVQPGDHIVAMNNGSWNGDQTGANHPEWTNQLNFTIGGTQAKPIVISPQSWLGFTFRANLVFEQTPGYIIFDGFEITSLATQRNLQPIDWQQHSGGVSITAPGVTLQNSFVHDIPTTPIGRWKTANGADLLGNLIFYNGGFWNADSSYPPGTPVGSGFYTQNMAGNAPFHIQGNITMFNWTTGGKAYSNSSSGDIVSAIQMTDNVAIRNHQVDLFYDSFNPSAVPPVFTNNVTYNYSGVISMQFGDLSTPAPVGSTGAAVIGNLAVNDAIDPAPGHPGSCTPIGFYNGWSNVSLINNTLIRPANVHGELFLEMGSVNDKPSPVATDTFLGNSYRSAGNSNQFWRNINSVYTFPQWQALLPGDTSTFDTSVHTAMEQRILQPTSDRDRIHVVIYNPGLATSATVNVAPYFNAGDMVKVWAADNFTPGTPQQTLTVASNQITLDLTQTAHRSPMGGDNAYSTPSYTDTFTGLPADFKVFIVKRYH